MKTLASQTESFVLFDHIPVGVCVIEEDFRVLFWNSCLEIWTQIPRHKILGEVLTEFYPHLEQPKYFKRLHQVFAGGPPILFCSQLHSYFFPIPFADGKLRAQQTTVTSLPTSNPKEYYAVLVVQDVTDVTYQTQAYRQMRDRALAEIKSRESIELALRESEERYAKIFTESPLGMALTGWDYEFIQVNKHLATMLGYEEAEFKTLKLLDLIHPEHSAISQKYFQDLVFGVRKSYKLEQRYLKKNGDILWVNTTVNGMGDRDGKPIYCLMIIEDISERKQSEQKLQQTYQQLENRVQELQSRNREITLLSRLSDGLQQARSLTEAYDYLSTLLEPLFPETFGGLLVLTENILQPVVTWGGENLPHPPFTPLLTITKPKECPEFLCIPLTQQGEELGRLYLENLPTATESLTGDNKYQLARTVAENLTLALANLKLRETLQELSVRDALTGLYNRRHLETFLAQELKGDPEAGYSVGMIMMDLDHFKQVNDTFGHEMGDRVLQNLADYLKQHLPSSALACRYGGEEFLIILPHTDSTQTQAQAEAIRQGIKNRRIKHHGQSIDTITLSLGTANFPRDGLTPAAVIRAADEALYQAKAKGRDRVVVFTPVQHS